MRPYLLYAAALLGILFLGIGFAVSHTLPIVSSIDAFGNAIASSYRSVAGSSFFLVITEFGSLFGIIAGLLVVMGIYRHRPDIVARLLIALLGVTVSGEYLKNFVHRLRPETLPWLQPIASYSFPSGHSGESMVLYGFLGILLYAHAPSRTRKFFAIFVPAAIILLVGFSRIALNYHYLSDVLGGYALGAFWLTLSLGIPLYYQLYHLNADHTEPIVRPVL